jgi:hypothetical protein
MMNELQYSVQKREQELTKCMHGLKKHRRIAMNKQEISKINGNDAMTRNRLEIYY